MDPNIIRELVESLSDPVVRRRIYTLADVAISIGKREGWVRDGMTREQALKAIDAQMRGVQPCEIKQGNINGNDENTSQVERQTPKRKEIRVRLSKDEWEQILVAS